MYCLSTCLQPKPTDETGPPIPFSGSLTQSHRSEDSGIPGDKNLLFILILTKLRSWNLYHYLWQPSTALSQMPRVVSFTPMASQLHAIHQPIARS